MSNKLLFFFWDKIVTKWCVHLLGSVQQFPKTSFCSTRQPTGCYFSKWTFCFLTKAKPWRDNRSLLSIYLIYNTNCTCHYIDPQINIVTYKQVCPNISWSKYTIYMMVDLTCITNYAELAISLSTPWPNLGQTLNMAQLIDIFNPVCTSVKVTPCFEDNKH